MPITEDQLNALQEVAREFDAEGARLSVSIAEWKLQLSDGSASHRLMRLGCDVERAEVRRRVALVKAAVLHTAVSVLRDEETNLSFDKDPAI